MRTAKTLLFLLLFYFTGVQTNAQPSKDIDSIRRQIASVPDSSKTAIYITLGKIYNRSGKTDSAYYYFEQGLQMARKQGDKKVEYSAMLSMASTNLRRKKYEEALDIYFKVIPVAEKEGWTKFIATAKIDIGYIYEGQNRTQEALKFLKEAEATLIQLKDTTELISLYTQLQVSVGKNGDTASAIAYSAKGFSLCDELKRNPMLSQGRRDFLLNQEMGLCYNSVHFLTKEEDIENTLRRVKRIHADILKQGNEHQESGILLLLANISHQLKKYREAQQYAESAILLYHPESGNFGRIRDLYYLVAEASASLGEHKKAYDALNMFRVYNDSLFNLSQLEAIASVETRYETAKKEEQIKILNKEKRNQGIFITGSIAVVIITLGLLLYAIRANRLQKKLFIKEKEAQKAELEKKMFELQQTALRAQMNPHFIFNCLNSVQRYVINNDVEGANSYISTFASLIRQTLENSGKKLIPLKDEVKYLETYISMEQMRSHNRFDYSITIDSTVNQSETFIPSMIVQPFIENSIKHGLMNIKNRKGFIHLGISLNQKLTCIVEDNGAGIRNTVTAKIADDDGHTSMGGAITEKRIQIYNSLNQEKIELQIVDMSDVASDESGTRIILKFPLDN